MNMFRAIGFIILLIALRVIVPEVFAAGQGLVLTLLHFLDGTVLVAGDALNQTASILNSVQ